MAEDLRSIGELLAEIGVPAHAYSLGHAAENAWCVVPAEPEPAPATGDSAAYGYEPDDEPDPVRPGAWEVYRSLGGTKQRLTIVSTEEAACDVLLGELGYGQRSWP